MNKLSHSQINTFSSCGYKYKMHYIARLREPINSAALLFGSALDNTLNTLLLDLKDTKLKSVTHYQTVFKQNWLQGKINNNTVDLPESLEIAYADSDHDYDLLQDADVAALYDRALTLIPNELSGNNKRESLEKAYGKLAAIKKASGIENIRESSAKYVNLENWHVLLRKGELMISAYMRDIVPRIKKVVDIQRKIELPNDEGDTVIGFIDAILDFGDGPRICDHKTSTMKYDADSADTSPQLTVYSHALRHELNNNLTAFIVFSKSIRKNKSKVCAVCRHDGTGSRARSCDNEINSKRCGGVWIEQIQPEAIIETIFGSIDPVFENNVLDNYEEVLRSIRAGTFYRNFNACHDFGRRCPYYNLCHKGKDDGLVKV